ncbi:MAG: hypothetical protein Q7K26_01130 [bacterium]|nr:hypothetical protein [bacterium]
MFTKRESLAKTLVMLATLGIGIWLTSINLGKYATYISPVFEAPTPIFILLYLMGCIMAMILVPVAAITIIGITGILGEILAGPGELKYKVVTGLTGIIANGTFTWLTIMLALTFSEP